MSTTTLSKVESAVDVLRNARSLIAAGWTQGTYCRITPEGKQEVCSEGAINRAFPQDEKGHYGNIGEYWDGAWDFLSRAVREAGGTTIVAYNDAPGRTQEEVLAVFDRSIEMASQA